MLSVSHFVVLRGLKEDRNYNPIQTQTNHFLIETHIFSVGDQTKITRKHIPKKTRERNQTKKNKNGETKTKMKMRIHVAKMYLSKVGFYY